MALRREVHFMKWNVIKSKFNSCKTQKLLSSCQRNVLPIYLKIFHGFP